MRKKVAYARMHEIKVVIEGIGQLPIELPSKAKSIPGLELWYDGVTLEFTTKIGSFGIPAANVQFVRYAPEETKVSAVKVAA